MTGIRTRFGPCSVEGCDVADVWGRGMCKRHYYRWYKTGTTDLRPRVYKASQRASTMRAVDPVGPRQIEWLAGFLEGEGTFVPNHGSGLVVAVQVEWGPIVRLVRQFGGTVTAAAVDVVSAKRNQPLRWCVSGSRARGLMMTIYPLMSPKRKQQIRKALGVPAGKIGWAA